MAKNANNGDFRGNAKVYEEVWQVNTEEEALERVEQEYPNLKKGNKAKHRHNYKCRVNGCNVSLSNLMNITFIYAHLACLQASFRVCIVVNDGDESERCTYERELERAVPCNHHNGYAKGGERGLTDKQKEYCRTLYEQGQDTVGKVMKRYDVV